MTTLWIPDQHQYEGGISGSVFLITMDIVVFVNFGDALIDFGSVQIPAKLVTFPPTSTVLLLCYFALIITAMKG